MNFNKTIRFVRINDKGQTEFLDVVPNKLKGWQIEIPTEKILEHVYFDEMLEPKERI